MRGENSKYGDDVKLPSPHASFTSWEKVQRLLDGDGKDLSVVRNNAQADAADDQDPPIGLAGAPTAARLNSSTNVKEENPASSTARTQSVQDVNDEASLTHSDVASRVSGSSADLIPGEQERQARESASKLLRKLTPDEAHIVERALYGKGLPSEALASQGADSVQRDSMQTLQPGQWLNDEVINYFLKNCLPKRDEMLCAKQPGRKRSHFFNSFFVQTMFDEKNDNFELRGRYNYEHVRNWSDKVPGKDIFNLKYIFCPINLDNMHWTSACIFMEEKKIRYFDSMGGSGRSKLKGLLQYLKDEWMAKKGEEMDVSEWELVECTDDTPRQLNGESENLLCFGPRFNDEYNI